MSAEDHDHDAEGNCIPRPGVVYAPPPAWRLSVWDLVSIACTGTAGLLNVAGQAGNMLAREFNAMANWSRQEYDYKIAREQFEEHQRAIGQDILDMINSSDES